MTDTPAPTERPEPRWKAGPDTTPRAALKGMFAVNEGDEDLIDEIVDFIEREAAQPVPRAEPDLPEGVRHRRNEAMTDTPTPTERPEPTHPAPNIPECTCDRDDDSWVGEPGEMPLCPYHERRLRVLSWESLACLVIDYEAALQEAAQPVPRAEPDPEIVVLCGSTRFYDDFQQANYDHTMAGRIVLSVGFYPHSKAVHGHGEGVGHDSTEKVALDELHKRKIDLADWVYVLNRDGYIGESTRSEIDYAIAHGKPVRFAFDEDGVGSLYGWLRPDHGATNRAVAAKIAERDRS